jgi:hypothetical protein
MINVIIVSISSRENYPRYEERPLIIPAALSNAAFKMMEHLQNKQFKLIIDISCGTDIPLDDLPNNIVELKCPDLGIHKLPGPLGNGLKIIRCENNNIHQICDGELPPSLLALNCPLALDICNVDLTKYHVYRILYPQLRCFGVMIIICTYCPILC